MDKLMNIFNWCRKELWSLFLLLVGILLAKLLFLIGIVYSLALKPLYHIFIKRDPMYAGKKLLRYFGNFLYQIWVVIKKLFLFAAELIDLLGNVFNGEMIEDIVTPEEKTLFGRGDVYISTALGELEGKARKFPKKLNDRGRFIIKVLNLFEPNHCNKSYRLWKYRKTLREEK